MADTVIGFALLVMLLVTGWTGKLRDWSYLGARQHYFFAVFLYVLMFSIIAKLISSPLDFIGFRLEHQIPPLEPETALVGCGTSGRAGCCRLVLGGIMVETHLRHHSHCAAALVDHRLGCLHRPFSADGAACAGGAVADLLQVQAAGERRPARSADEARRARRHARPRRVRVEAFGEIEEGERGADWPGLYPPHHSRRHAATNY